MKTKNLRCPECGKVPNTISNWATTTIDCCNIHVQNHHLKPAIKMWKRIHRIYYQEPN